MPRVSVIVPNFNHAKYLEQRIESILSQTFQDFELILMDDCSTDDSRKVLARYRGHPKVTQVIFNEQNSGSTFKQWKKGVNVAQGTYIWIAESDDWCDPTLLETLIAGIEKDKNTVISYCQSYCVNDQHDIIFQSNHRVLSETVDGNQFIQNYLSVPVAIFNASMAIWRKDKFDQIPEQLTTFRFCGDWFFWIQLSRSGKVHISGKILNYFRKHGNDVSGKAYQSGLNFVEELRILNMMYTDQLITERQYYRAYKKKFIDYWQVKDTIEKANKDIVKNLFNNSLSTKTSMIKLVPIAIWKKFKQKKK
ncbi:glycosyltransferase family 2 protein [Pedobacter polysacchareus]|uniref:glycosyltransferase family 2 protein n=1 Tax=Pedobacter polysacchareus TaxID=2861973 RepID=UPI001C9941B5|nr:glycosyltransferase family 2 protein [Pedobacter polysacchareus]